MITTNVSNFRRTAFYLNLFLLLFLSLHSLVVCSQEDGILDSSREPIELFGFNGFDLEQIDGRLAYSDGNVTFSTVLEKGFYQMRSNKFQFSTFFFSDGKRSVKCEIDTSLGQGGRVMFEDPDNQAFQDILIQKSNHFQRVLDLRKNLPQTQIDSFYFTRLVETQKLITEETSRFNKSLTRFEKNNPNSSLTENTVMLSKTPVFYEDSMHSRYYDNQDAYLRDHFFDGWKLENEEVILHPDLNMRITEYLQRYCNREVNFTVNKCQEIYQLSSLESVRTYVATVLLRFFRSVQEKDVEEFITRELLKNDLSKIDESNLELRDRNVKSRPVSSIELPNSNGQLIDFQSVCTSSELTVLYFWMPDCGQCEALHPVINEARTKFKTVSFYGVAVTDDVDSWKSALSDYDVMEPSVIASNEDREFIVLDFGFTRTPHIVLVNQSGFVLEKDIEGSEIIRVISSYLD